MARHAEFPGRSLLAVVAALLLSACAVGTPIAGPDGSRLAPVTGAAGEVPVVVSITHITLQGDRAARSRFWDAVSAIDGQIRSQPGFIGYAKRTEVFGDESWTVSVWQDRASLSAFMRSGAHAAAMRDLTAVIGDARFARLELPRSRIPLSWDAVLAELDRNPRQYYE